MASFDFIDAAAKGYDVVFRNFVYLARVAVPVLFITILCFLIIIIMSSDNVLRAGLVFFPAFLVQGIYCAGLVRFALYNEPIHVWGSLVPAPERSSEKTDGLYVQGYRERNQSLQASAVCYTLISMLYILFIGFMGDLEHAAVESARSPEAMSAPPGAENPVLVGLIMLLPILAVFVWAIRLLYVYVPIAMGLGYKDYMHAMRGMMSSVSISAMFMLCTLPIITLSSPLFQFITFLFKPFPMILPVALIAVLTIIMLLSLSVLVAAAAFGINQVMQKDMRPR